MTSPKFELSMSPLGLKNCAWLKTLKNSARISKAFASVKGIRFDIPTFQIANARSVEEPAVGGSKCPKCRINRKRAGQEIASRAGSRNGRIITWTLGVHITRINLDDWSNQIRHISGSTSWSEASPELWFIWTGNPLAKRVMPSSCHPCVNRLGPPAKIRCLMEGPKRN